jgi:hypothetical protein
LFPATAVVDPDTKSVVALGREFRAEISLEENNLLYFGIWFVVVDQTPDEREDEVTSVVVEKYELVSESLLTSHDPEWRQE